MFPLVLLPLPNLRREMRLTRIRTTVVQILFALILQATNTFQADLIVAAVEHVLAVGAHVPEVRAVAVARVLASTPPAAAVADKVETIATQKIAGTARQGGKAILVFTIAIVIPTICCFQLGSGTRTMAIV